MAMRLRIATFNLENLDDKPGQKPSLDERIELMRPQLVRINADVLCLQEANGQEAPSQPRRLLALDKLLAGTIYQDYKRASTMAANKKDVYDERNLVILSRFEILESKQFDAENPPMYRKVTADPPETLAKAVNWERPILYARLKLDAERELHVLNVHMKSKLPTEIPGQMLGQDKWKSCTAWAEGSFLSAMKRFGQALQTRQIIDSIFDAVPQAWLTVCGDFNAEADEVSLEAIRGDVENTNNAKLSNRVLVPCERTVPESSRFSLYHRGRGTMIDHILASRGLLAHYDHTEIHNELLHDESVAFAVDTLYPESDHAPVIAEFNLPS
ncbi:MAG TPA: endonuclease/exonuclease/phosphatase family protein [Blastocatellia bacterium]|nr:endonuclease/exonuclease/phosphatase family protein [Blastocatellia bacterium]